MTKRKDAGEDQGKNILQAERDTMSSVINELENGVR